MDEPTLAIARILAYAFPLPEILNAESDNVPNLDIPLTS